MCLCSIDCGVNTSILEAESTHPGYLLALSVTGASEVNTCHACYSLEHLQNHKNNDIIIIEIKLDGYL